MKKITLISSWNALDGVATHAELIVRGWLKLGYQIKVLLHWNHLDEKIIYYNNKDQSFVKRVFSFLRHGNRYVNEEIFDQQQFQINLNDLQGDFFVVEKPSSIPLKKLLPLFSKIKQKAKTIAIFHEGTLPSNPYFYSFSWDKIIVFDRRFKQLFSQKFPSQMIKIVPFPVFNPPIIKRKKPKKSPNKPLQILTFERNNQYEKIKLVLNILRKEKINFHYTCIVPNIESYENLSSLAQTEKDFTLKINRNHFMDKNFIDKINHFDVMIFLYPPSPERLVVSSFAYVLIGFQIPLIVPDNEYFYHFKNEVLKYKKIEEIPFLIKNLEKNQSKLLSATVKFLENHQEEKIASRILLS